MTEGRIVLGRSQQCDVHIEDGGASRQHATLEPLPDGTVQLVELESRNGTFVNGERISRKKLRDGDKIQIGDTTILKLSKELAFARRHKRALSLLLLDVDHFKNVNDTYGHPAGDYVLRRLAEAITTTIRAEDVLARIGGEEFGIVLRDIALDSALACAERMRARVESSVFTIGNVRAPITISVGVATLQLEPDLAAFVAEADEALYEAKRVGRNLVVVAGIASSLR